MFETEINVFNYSVLVFYSRFNQVNKNIFLKVRNLGEKKK